MIKSFRCKHTKSLFETGTVSASINSGESVSSGLMMAQKTLRLLIIIEENVP